MNDQDKLAAVKELLNLFRYERFTYLAVNIIALLMLLGSAAVLLLRPHENGGVSLYAVVTALFGSSGLITFSIGRLLHMWDQAFDLLTKQFNAKGNGE